MPGLSKTFNGCPTAFRDFPRRTVDVQRRSKPQFSIFSKCARRHFHRISDTLQGLPRACRDFVIAKASMGAPNAFSPPQRPPCDKRFPNRNKCFHGPLESLQGSLSACPGFPWLSRTAHVLATTARSAGHLSEGFPRPPSHPPQPAGRLVLPAAEPRVVHLSVASVQMFGRVPRDQYFTHSGLGTRKAVDSIDADGRRRVAALAFRTLVRMPRNRLPPKSSPQRSPGAPVAPGAPVPPGHRAGRAPLPTPRAATTTLSRCTSSPRRPREPGGGRRANAALYAWTGVCHRVLYSVGHWNNL